MSRTIELHPYGFKLKLHKSMASLRRTCAKGKKAKREWDERWNGETCASALCVRHEGNFHIYAYDAQSLAHELIHAGILLLEDVGIDPTHAAGEPLAYLVWDCMHRLKDYV